jgi:hypothetical protein
LGGALHTFQDIQAHNYAYVIDHLGSSAWAWAWTLDDPFDNVAMEYRAEAAVFSTDYYLEKYLIEFGMMGMMTRFKF